jgi:anti-sigma factor RsiW
VDEKRPDLKAVLRELAAEESGDAGPHVGSKRLIAYRQGTLPAAERETVQEHLSRCPRCTGLWRELKEFETAAARGDAGPEPQRREAWESLAGRLAP